MLNLSVAMRSGFGNDWYDPQEVWARQQAVQLFDRAFVRGRLRRIWSRLTRRPYRLLSLVEVQKGERFGSTFSAGIKTVKLDEIRGSQERNQDFDDAFFPYREHVKERWVRVAMARHLGISLPPVRLVRIGTYYFVEDGHHRISVARALGQQEMEAEVTVLLDNRELLLKQLARMIGASKEEVSLLKTSSPHNPVGFGWPKVGAVHLSYRWYN